MGMKKILAKFRDSYRGQQETAIAKEVYQTCTHCQVSKDYRPHTQNQPGSIRDNERFETLSIDVEGPFNTEGIPKFIITVLDTFSGYLLLMPTKKHDARTTAELLMKHVFS